MTRIKQSTLLANPFTIWTTLAFRTGEMLWASSQVIGERTTRALMADPKHKERDRRELGLMTSEKVEAAATASVAMAGYLTSLNLQYANAAFRQGMAITEAMLSMASSRSVAQLLAQQTRLAQAAWLGTANTASDMAGSAARLAHHGLKPIHARATRNAKRLRRK